jgi:hypothetical protein
MVTRELRGELKVSKESLDIANISGGYDGSKE